MKKQLKLNVFLAEAGHHEAAWRHPLSGAERVGEFAYYQELVKKAEAALFDAVFLADVPALFPPTPYRPSNRFEPLTLLSAVAASTEKIGLVSTASTTFYDPFTLARLFASLDQISGGRAGWNIVSSWHPDAGRNYGIDEMSAGKDRYREAQEFLDVCSNLWDSWEDDAILVDRDSGYYYDPSKVHSINHDGPTLKVAGPLNAARSPQGRPVYFQAGSSEDGRAFGARNAEAIFTAQQEIGLAQEFYADIKSRAVAAGRRPEHVLILPGLAPFIGDTTKEAEEYYEYVTRLTVPALGLAQLDAMLGVSAHHLELDEKIPLELFVSGADEADTLVSRRQVVAGIVEREQPTLRELLFKLAGGRGHSVVKGTPTEVADVMHQWLLNEAADGFNLMPPVFPLFLDAFIDKVIPLLQDRGIFRTEYTGSTLRDHYGLPRPESVYAS